MLQMTFDAQTNAGKRVMSNVVSVVTCDTLYTKDSVLGSGQKTLYFMTLCKFPPFCQTYCHVRASDKQFVELSISA